MTDKPLSVLLAALPADRVELRGAELAARWQPLIAAREQVNKALEGIKGRPQSAITLLADTATYRALLPYLTQLPALLLVSSVTLREGNAAGLEVTHDGPAPGVKCARCWVAVTDGGDDPAAQCAAGCARAWQTAGDAASRLLP